MLGRKTFGIRRQKMIHSIIFYTHLCDTLRYLLFTVENISPLFPTSPVTAEDPLTQLFCLLSQHKMQYRIRVQIQNLLTLRKIHFCRFVQSYYLSELPCGPNINKSKCMVKSICFFAMLHLHHFLIPAVQRQNTLITQR